MNRLIFFLLLLFVLIISIPVNINARENSSSWKELINDDYIYIKVVIDGKTIVYVYLSDGITLVNVYEEDD